MILKSELKEEGGKLVKTTLEVEENMILKAEIHGDFFLHPEEGIEEIERFFYGKKLTEENKNELIDGLKNLIKKKKMELFGLKVETIVEVLFKALESRQK